MSQPYKILARHTRILNQHKEALFVKGYTETMLNSFAEKGYFIKQLKAAIKHASDLTFWEYRLEQFQLAMSGFFTKEKHKVDFLFTYTYDPCNVRLTMDAMKATMMEDYSIDFDIQGNPTRNLQSADKVYFELIALKNAELLAKVQPKPKRTRRPKSK